MSTAAYIIQAEDADRRGIKGEADDIHAALDAAWQLNRHIEDTVEILDNRDGEPRRVARVSVEWLEG